MKPQMIALTLFTLGFASFTLWAIGEVGLAGAWQSVWLNPMTAQITLDLVIALALVCGWMWRDARQHGRSALPFVLATALLGSIAPLVYLMVRARWAARAPRPAMA